MNHFNIALTMFAFLLPTFSVFSQTNPQIDVKDLRWQHLDLKRDGVYGISMDRAYQSLPQGITPEPIIVAVIDSGFDTLNEDLSPVIWRNTKELGGDEDKNGYVNDKYGWNFVGLKHGDLMSYDPGPEYRRVYLSLTKGCEHYFPAEYAHLDNNCNEWLAARAQFKLDSVQKFSANLSFWNEIAKEDSLWKMRLGKESYTVNDLHLDESEARRYIMPSLLKVDSLRTNSEQLALITEAKIRLFKKYSQHPLIFRAETIGDDYSDLTDKFYGDGNVRGTGYHGTHVASVVGAVRNNNVGIDGIANFVKIMMIRAVFGGADEYDKDIALAIRYAVDNGAKIINMSFGKPYSPQRNWVEDALKYAGKMDVLVIHAAGNDGVSTDSSIFYPSPTDLNGRLISNMITVGASGPQRKDIIASFSNYGKASVDVFAPGVNIYCDADKARDSNYDIVSGTSVAAPVVSGLAAVLRAYYPKLSATEVKRIIESTVTKVDGFVTRPGGTIQVPMSSLCRTGGVVNAYRAIRMANKLYKRR